MLEKKSKEKLFETPDQRKVLQKRKHKQECQWPGKEPYTFVYKSQSCKHCLLVFFLLLKIFIFIYLSAPSPSAAVRIFNLKPAESF